ncbi:MAG: hypothetical protein IJB05_04005 [Bacteroidales bacterium]|nr:hypothetical protein [Bacteroidales bacterium]
MNEGFKITEAIRRALDAMAELEIDTIYDAESGDFIFTYNLVEMVVLATKGEGGVCLSAEFVMDRYMDTIARLWLEVLNRNGEGFTLQEPYPGVGRISREWLIDWEKPLPAEDLEAMLEVMAAACKIISDNLTNLRVPEEDDYN